jgi:hypothetical protein
MDLLAWLDEARLERIRDAWDLEKRRRQMARQSEALQALRAACDGLVCPGGTTGAAIEVVPLRERTLSSVFAGLLPELVAGEASGDAAQRFAELENAIRNVLPRARVLETDHGDGRITYSIFGQAYGGEWIGLHLPAAARA